MATFEHDDHNTFSLHNCSLPHLVERQANQHPEAPAITAPGRPPLTYHQLYAQVTDVRTMLHHQGVGAQDRVAVVLPNGPEMAVAFLALASTATCAPLNPAYRKSELEFYLADLRAKALVIQADLASPAREVAQAQGIPVLELTPAPDREAGVFTLSGDSTAQPALGQSVQPQDVALVLHTSGTTSRPKLVPLTHANLLASATHIVASLKLTPQDCCLNIMPLFHIHGLVGALMASLTAGGQVVCTPGFDAARFFEWLDTFAPTWYTAVPTMHQAVLGLAADLERIPPKHLRLIRSSSAPLPTSVMTEMERVFQVPVLESYGMTEAAHQMASNPIPPHMRKAGSVGLAAGPELAILDEAGRTLPKGTTGEVAIRGPNVMRGYEGNSEANKQAFSAGWFRTGDQGYLDFEGYLFLTGRVKELINRGGEKVAPREVEELLLGHPGVSQAVVFGMPHVTLGEEVAAAVVLGEPDKVKERELQEYMMKRIAEFKVPKRIVELAELPKGPTGKLQRVGMAEQLGLCGQAEMKVSPQPGEEVPNSQGATEPSNGFESIVAGIYAEVLGRERIGVHEDFFALGGDSIRATQIVFRLQAMLPMNLDAVMIFQKPTVAELSQEILNSLDPDEITRISQLLNEVGGPANEEPRR